MDLSGLNEQQKVAVEASQGPIMILAGAGSGKTRTLVTKIAYLLNEKGVGPHEILALTFSNKAAQEMRSRVAADTHLPARALKITTFHSFCAQLLRQEARYLGLGQNFTIYDDGESRAIVKAILKKRNIDPKEVPPRVVQYYISSLKNTGYYPGRGEKTKGAFREQDLDLEEPWHSYYLDYQQELHRSNALDFSGLISGALELLESYPEVRERHSRRYQHVLVDEYQDTNRSQFDLLVLLSGYAKSVCVVGDEDQSIYSWRGADIGNILDFEKTFPGVKVLKLEQNYRSTKKIIEAASLVIAKNEQRMGKTLWTDNDEGPPIEVLECESDKAEAMTLAREVAALAAEKVSLRDVGVFYRSNNQSRLLEDALRETGIPYRIVGGIKFYERKEIKDLLSYIRLVVNPKDSLALARIINVPARGVGAVSLRKLEGRAVLEGLALGELITRVVKHPDDYKDLRLSSKIQAGLSSLILLIEETRAMEREGAGPYLCYEKLLKGSGILELLEKSKDYESKARVENLEELGSALKQYQEDLEHPTLSGFLEMVGLDSSSRENDVVNDSAKEGENHQEGELALMTVHSSKGLEFPYVFIVGMEENLFPSYKSLEGGEDALEEERRLFYVAMTRAMKKLSILFGQRRMVFGEIQYQGPSRFIDEIPDNFRSWRRPSLEDGMFFAGERRGSSGKKRKKEPSYGQRESSVSFPRGTCIKHGLYGKGVVMETTGQGADEKVLIRFLEGIQRRFLVRHAPLTKI